ncbi:MAG: DnaJ family molecular chaperone [Limisphaerales bacterium]
MSDLSGGGDAYRRLGESRRPWLDAEALRARFVEISTESHPDRHHEAAGSARDEVGRKYAELNEAYQVLKEPRTRLLHLLELELGRKPGDIQKIPPGTMDLFVEVGQLCRDVDGFLARRGGVTSPMLKVRLFTEGMEWVAKLKELLGRVAARERSLGEELERMNEVWVSAPPEGSPDRRAALPLVRLEEIYRVLSYSARWTGQIQERLVELASV